MNNRTDMTREQIADWLAASGLDAEIPDTLTVAEEMSVADAKARRPEMADKIEAAARKNEDRPQTKILLRLPERFPVRAACAMQTPSRRRERKSLSRRISGEAWGEITATAG